LRKVILILFLFNLLSLFFVKQNIYAEGEEFENRIIFKEIFKNLDRRLNSKNYEDIKIKTIKAECVKISEIANKFAFIFVTKLRKIIRNCIISIQFLEKIFRTYENTFVFEIEPESISFTLKKILTERVMILIKPYNPAQTERLNLLNSEVFNEGNWDSALLKRYWFNLQSIIAGGLLKKIDKYVADGSEVDELLSAVCNDISKKITYLEGIEIEIKEFEKVEELKFLSYFEKKRKFLEYMKKSLKGFSKSYVLLDTLIKARPGIISDNVSGGSSKLKEKLKKIKEIVEEKILKGEGINITDLKRLYFDSDELIFKTQAPEVAKQVLSAYFDTFVLFLEAYMYRKLKLVQDSPGFSEIVTRIDNNMKIFNKILKKENELKNFDDRSSREIDRSLSSNLNSDTNDADDEENRIRESNKTFEKKIKNSTTEVMAKSPEQDIDKDEEFDIEVPEIVVPIPEIGKEFQDKGSFSKEASYKGEEEKKNEEEKAFKLEKVEVNKEVTIEARKKDRKIQDIEKSFDLAKENIKVVKKEQKVEGISSVGAKKKDLKEIAEQEKSIEGKKEEKRQKEIKPGNRCYKCSALLPDKAKFCPECGGCQFCPKCNMRILKEYKFCPNCGYKLVSKAQTFAKPIKIKKKVSSGTLKKDEIKEKENRTISKKLKNQQQQKKKKKKSPTAAKKINVVNVKTVTSQSRLSLILQKYKKRKQLIYRRKNSIRKTLHLKKTVKRRSHPVINMLLYNRYNSRVMLLYKTEFRFRKPMKVSRSLKKEIKNMLLDVQITLDKCLKYEKAYGKSPELKDYQDKMAALAHKLRQLKEWAK